MFFFIWTSKSFFNVCTKNATLSKTSGACFKNRMCWLWLGHKNGMEFVILAGVRLENEYVYCKCVHYCYISIFLIRLFSWLCGNCDVRERVWDCSMCSQGTSRWQSSSRGAQGQRTQGDTHRHRLVQNTKISSEMESTQHYNLLTLLTLLILIVNTAYIAYDKVSDVAESWLQFASKILTPCRMH